MLKKTSLWSDKGRRLKAINNMMSLRHIKTNDRNNVFFKQTNVLSLVLNCGLLMVYFDIFNVVSYASTIWLVRESLEVIVVMNVERSFFHVDANNTHLYSRQRDPLIHTHTKDKFGRVLAEDRAQELKSGRRYVDGTYALHVLLT